MRDFICKTSDSEKGFDFIDEKDLASFLKLMSFIKKRGVDKFVISIKEYKKTTSTEKQINFINIMIDKISKESGQDFQSVKKELIGMKSSKSDLEDMTYQEIDLFINEIIIFSRDFFNIDINIDENNIIRFNE